MPLRRRTSVLLAVAATLRATAAKNCSAEFGPCMDTGCCTNPGFACYKKTTKHWAQCLRHRPGCKDTSEWLCPGWDKCSAPFQDCRHSLCCQENGDHCLRRPHLYWATCRRPSQEMMHGGHCKDAPDWLCPGWEKCVAPEEECTKSRCCTNKDYGCYLNQTLLEQGGGWHAFCQPHPIEVNATIANETKVRKGWFNQLSQLEMMSLFSLSRSNSTSGAADLINKTAWLCELGTTEWACKSKWVSSARSYYAYLDKVASDMEHELSPVAVFGIVLGSLFAAVCLFVLVVALVSHHNRVRSRLIQAELELDALRKFAPKDPPLGSEPPSREHVAVVDPETNDDVIE